MKSSIKIYQQINILTKDFLPTKKKCEATKTQERKGVTALNSFTYLTSFTLTISSYFALQCFNHINSQKKYSARHPSVNGSCTSI